MVPFSTYLSESSSSEVVHKEHEHVIVYEIRLTTSLFLTLTAIAEHRL